MNRLYDTRLQYRKSYSGSYNNSDYITDYTINLVYAPRDEPRTITSLRYIYIYIYIYTMLDSL